MDHNRTTDSDYRGNAAVFLFNFSYEEYVVQRDDCIAQMIIERYCSPKFLKLMNLPKIQLKKGKAVSVLQEFDVSHFSFL